MYICSQMLRSSQYLYQIRKCVSRIYMDKFADVRWQTDKKLLAVCYLITSFLPFLKLMALWSEFLSKLILFYTSFRVKRLTVGFWVGVSYHHHRKTGTELSLCVLEDFYGTWKSSPVAIDEGPDQLKKSISRR